MMEVEILLLLRALLAIVMIILNQLLFLHGGLCVSVGDAAALLVTQRVLNMLSSWGNQRLFSLFSGRWQRVSNPHRTCSEPVANRNEASPNESRNRYRTTFKTQRTDNECACKRHSRH